ncbi:efflux RND transporter periplasmic adaptor subunit [Acidocella sp.]|uniref:efflux RND transporter periplasmic adaptor subunit n=1 Tax=Acidocella sp. TaxID=50710 RepID=UPI0026087D39|nr:efflux RND transporter periplasmic adaptor subunit [Acidocella sp.]
MRARPWLFALGLGLAATPALAQPVSFTVAANPIDDQKPVFATVEASHVVAARARIGGTVMSYLVQDGDMVKAGQVIATVADSSMAQQLAALSADITAARAQLSQANTDLARAQKLVGEGAVSRSVYDQAKTEVNVATATLNAKIAAHDALSTQIKQGAVLAPVDGRVLLTQVTEGTVVEPGESIATIAEAGYVLRLDVPERHARFLHVGDPVRLDSPRAEFGRITLVYPQIQNGQVEADATAPDIGGYFVGARVRVWVFVGQRPGIVIPSSFIDERFGLDYADVSAPNGKSIAVPIQLGQPAPTPGLPDGVEVLSGLKPGDVLMPVGSAP